MSFSSEGMIKISDWKTYNEYTPHDVNIIFRHGEPPKVISEEQIKYYLGLTTMPRKHGKTRFDV